MVARNCMKSFGRASAVFHIATKETSAIAVFRSRRNRANRSHAVRTVATLPMHDRVVEEHAVVPSRQLLVNHVSLVGPPIGVVHAGRLISAAIPRRQRAAVAVLLSPLRRRRVEAGTERWVPMGVEFRQVDDRGRTEITNH